MIVDTGVLLRILRDRKFFERIKPKILDYKITIITAYELLRMAFYLKLRGSNKELEVLEELLSEIETLPFTMDDLRLSVEIWAKLREKDIKVNDAVVMISAICIRNKEKLITFESDFEHVKEIFKEFDVEILK